MSVNTLCVHLVLSFHQSCVSHFKYKDTIKPSLAKNHQERSTRIESHFSNIRTSAIPEAKGVPKAHWVETSLTENVETYSRCASLKDRGETRKCTGLPYTIRACTDITLATVLAEEAATRLMRVCDDLKCVEQAEKFLMSQLWETQDTKPLLSGSNSCNSLHLHNLNPTFLRRSYPRSSSVNFGVGTWCNKSI